MSPLPPRRNPAKTVSLVCVTRPFGLVLGVLSCFALTQEAQWPSYKPAGGYVPDAKTAIQIAVAVWSPIYGERKIQDEKPFHATLKRGVWTVTGSLPLSKPGVIMHGGVALARLSKADGRILQVIHGK